MHVYRMYQNSPSKSFLTFSFWATLMNWYWTRKTTNKKTFLCLNIDVHTLNISQTWPHIWDQDYQLINQIKNEYNTRNYSSCVMQSILCLDKFQIDKTKDSITIYDYLDIGIQLTSLWIEMKFILLQFPLSLIYHVNGV